MNWHTPPRQPTTKQILQELVELAHDTTLKGLAIQIVMEDGNLRTLSAYENGGKLPLLAAMVCAQHSYIAKMTSEPPPESPDPGQSELPM